MQVLDVSKPRIGTLQKNYFAGDLSTGFSAGLSAG
jgi:hypothetical protein